MSKSLSRIDAPFVMPTDLPVKHKIRKRRGWSPKSRALTEDAIQVAVFEHLRRRPAPGVFAFHPKNGGPHQSTDAQRIRNAARGVVSGMPDIMILRKLSYLGESGIDVFGLELKTEDGKLSPDQSDTLDALDRIGVTTKIAYGLDDALDWLEFEGLLIGERQ